MGAYEKSRGDEGEPNLFSAPLVADKLFPITPFNNSSGNSGSKTSEERSIREDHNGTTSKRQRSALQLLNRWEKYGATWQDLATYHNWHHGQASSVLSILHRKGIIVRLAETRDRCAIYVLPQFVDGREVSERKVKTCPNCGWHQ